MKLQQSQEFSSIWLGLVLHVTNNFIDEAQSVADLLPLINGCVNAVACINGEWLELRSRVINSLGVKVQQIKLYTVQGDYTIAND